MNFKDMWYELKSFLQRVEKTTEQISTEGMLTIISEIENAEYVDKNGDLPF